MEASIIILTRNGGDNFPRLLERIYSQRFEGGFEVIVIDSGSTDDTLNAARRYPMRLHEITVREFHHSRTRNLGAEMAAGRYLVYITQDALPVHNEWLQKLIDSFRDPKVAMVVGRQIAWEHAKPPERFFYRYNFPDFRIVVKSDAEDYYHDNVFISNVNAAYRREIVIRYRFDENLVMAEDKEIAARLMRDGYTIMYEPEAAVYHAHDYGLKDVFRRSLDYGLAMKEGASRLPGTAGTALEHAAVYLREEMNYLNEGKCLKWVPYAVIYEICRYAGLAIGRVCGVGSHSLMGGGAYD